MADVFIDDQIHIKTKFCVFNENILIWHEFNAQHAFMRDEDGRYDKALAIQVYLISVELFKRKLG